LATSVAECWWSGYARQQKTLNRALYTATGIILAVIAVEVMTEALNNTPSWLLALAFLAGGGAYMLVEASIEHWQERKQTGVGSGAWMVYVAVATDLMGDGHLIGARSAVSTKIALILALGQILADIPEGFAVVANFRDKGIKREKRLLISAPFVIPVVGTAVIAYFLLRWQGEFLKMAGLVFVAGLYTLAAVEDILR
jgi:ZIP family zinc transporter